MEDLIHSRMEAAEKKQEREREREQQLRAQGGFRAWLYDRKQLWKRMREERKEEKRKAAQREEEERWQEAEFLRRQARATEEARVEALMRGEAAPSQSTAEQIFKYGPSAAVEVAHHVRNRAAELAEWDEDDKVGEPLGFRRRLTRLTRGELWNQSIAWADGGGGGGGGLRPMQRSQAQREDYERRLAAWKANGSPLDPEQAARARHGQCVQRFKRTETAICYPLLAKPRAGLQLQSKNFVPNGCHVRWQHSNGDPPTSRGGLVGRLINAGGVPLLLSYTPLLVPLLD